MKKQFMAQMDQMMSVCFSDMAPVAFAAVLVIALALAIICAPVIIMLALIIGANLYMTAGAGKQTQVVG